MMHYGCGMLGYFGMIIPLLLIALIIYVVVRLAQGNNGKNNTRDGRNDSIEILKERYAKGEISEEYIHKKKILKD